MQRLIGSRLLSCGTIFVAMFGFFAAHSFAAEISNVKITDIADNKASITWDTDTETNATINYGLDDSFGIVRDPALVKEQLLTIENLDPSTTYHFRVVSADSAGNTSATAGF